MLYLSNAPLSYMVYPQGGLFSLKGGYHARPRTCKKHPKQVFTCYKKYTQSKYDYRNFATLSK